MKYLPPCYKLDNTTAWNCTSNSSCVADHMKLAYINPLYFQVHISTEADRQVYSGTTRILSRIRPDVHQHLAALWATNRRSPYG